MKQMLFGLCSLFTLSLILAEMPASGGDKTDQPDEKGWVQLFNGKDLKGWKTHPKNPGKWSVDDGLLVGRGKETSHLFSERGDYENFHFRIKAKINDKGNSGQYFRTAFGPGYPDGYEAQINATHPDPVKTGSLYPSGRLKLNKGDKEKIVVTKILAKPDEWFTQEVIAKGNHIIIKVNGKTTVDWIDENKNFTKGHFAIQGHPPAPGSDESIVKLEKIEVKELPATK
jgi:hypothetical protein